MGLDSIELVMEIEKYFGISISDPEAEKATTIQEMVDTVANHLNVTESVDLQYEILERVNQTLLKLGLIEKKIDLTDYPSKYLFPDNKEIWNAFKNDLQLDVPKPEFINRNTTSIINKIINVIKWSPFYEWTTITFSQFITAICANNYEELLDRENIKSKYEIYVAVTAITVNKIGVDYYEIEPEKSFTNDLGVD